jgi:hypothetical protein
MQPDHAGIDGQLRLNDQWVSHVCSISVRSLYLNALRRCAGSLTRYRICRKVTSFDLDLSLIRHCQHGGTGFATKPAE